MAHFAKLDPYNVVLEVHAVHDNCCMDYSTCEESEAKGIEFLTQWSGGYALWKQTSYNGSIRKNFAGIGYIYDPQRDAFIPPKPFASWVLDEDTCRWKSPVQMPNDGERYSWDEDSLAWVVVPAAE